MIKWLFKRDDNLLSFLCGIISNIPISLIFQATKFGTTCWEHVYFGSWITALAVSIGLTVAAFALTLKKIAIQKDIDKESDEVGKAAAEAEGYEKNKGYLRAWLIAFFACVAVVLLAVGGMLVSVNFIDY